MLHKNKDSIFVFQIREDSFKVIKCVAHNDSGREFVDLSFTPIAQKISEQTLSEKIAQALLKDLKYNHNPIIVSLPRYLAVCRYLKIPAQGFQEIENIVSLQASQCLPFPTHDLISGFEVISSDQEGYSNIELIIVHKEIIERYIRLLKDTKPANLTITLSSYGLYNLYAYIRPESTEPVMLIDIDSYQVDLVLVFEKKVLFSRSFRLNRLAPNWEKLLTYEINNTRDAYIKETSCQAPQKIIIFEKKNISSNLAKILTTDLGLPVESIAYTDKINLSKKMQDAILDSETSFNSLIGLGLGKLDKSLNLIPMNIKDKFKAVSIRKRLLKMALSISCIILLLVVGTVKNLDNKERYLTKLKAQLTKISKDALPLEETAKRLRFMESQLKKKPTCLEAFYELHQDVPDGITLGNFIYEEDSQIVLRGQSGETNSVFSFVSRLEKSLLFKDFDVKVRYVSKKKAQSGEYIEFEIVCSKK